MGVRRWPDSPAGGVGLTHATVPEIPLSCTVADESMSHRWLVDSSTLLPLALLQRRLPVSQAYIKRILQTFLWPLLVQHSLSHRPERHTQDVFFTPVALGSIFELPPKSHQHDGTLLFTQS